MRRLATARVAVVIAAIDARRTVHRSLSRLRDEVGYRGEMIVVDASRDATADKVERQFPDLRVLRRPAGALAPELWRDGLNATSAPLVALTTASMVPARGWLNALLGRMEATGAAAVGGPIVPAASLSVFERAVYLHRYLKYLSPIGEDTASEPPGDNVLYRRDRLAALSQHWEQGFWEVAIHRQLQAQGDSLAMASDAVVAYHGGGRQESILSQRLSHARWYGSDRSLSWSIVKRLIHSAGTPAVPGVMCSRVIRELIRLEEPLGRWLPALPDLALLLMAWSAGEAAGYWLGPVRVRSEARERQVGSEEMPDVPKAVVPILASLGSRR